MGRTGLDGRPVPVEQDGTAGPALLLAAEQLIEPFQAKADPAGRRAGPRARGSTLVGYGSARSRPEGWNTAAAAWHALVGPPLRARDISKEQITPVEGLSALSLDALTSVAYGPEAILVVLAAAGAGALHLILPITVAIVVLLAILVFSYRQVIDAYPHGGGAYAVSRDNFGAGASLVAGAALIVDYTLTVAVSIAAGVARSPRPSRPSPAPRCPSAWASSPSSPCSTSGASVRRPGPSCCPTLVFIVGLLAIIAVGLIHPLALHEPHSPAARWSPPARWSR